MNECSLACYRVAAKSLKLSYLLPFISSKLIISSVKLNYDSFSCENDLFSSHHEIYQNEYFIFYLDIRNRKIHGDLSPVLNMISSLRSLMRYHAPMYIIKPIYLQFTIYLLCLFVDKSLLHQTRNLRQYKFSKMHLKF